MAFPVAAAIAGGASLLGAGSNAWAQGKMNKKTRQFSLDMYNRQLEHNREHWNWQNEYNEQWRDDERAYNQKMWEQQNSYNEGLWNKQNAYNEEMWRRQNEYNEQRWHIENAYNSPEAQMRRFKEAGLNPNLIYGQSNMGGSITSANFDSARHGSSDMAGASSRGGSGPAGASAPNWNPRTPNFDMSNGILSYFDAKERQARTNNLEATNELIKQDAALRTAQVAETGARTASTISSKAKTDFELSLASELRKTSVDAAQAGLRKVQLESEYLLNKDERETIGLQSSLSESAARIAQLRGQTISQELDARLKKLDIELKQMGIQPGDNLFIRILGRILTPESVQDILKFGNKEAYEFGRSLRNK